MDAKSYVIGVEQFFSRWGWPAIIWSDNGTNIVGAEKEVRENIEKCNSISIAAELSGDSTRPARQTKVAYGRG